MCNIKFLKTLTAGVALATALYPQAWAVIQTGTDCDGKCDWVYDSAAEGGPSLVFTAKEGATGELEIKNNYYVFSGVNGGYDLNLQPKNVTIGEGITAISHTSATTPLHNLGIGGGKLTLPSTLTEWQNGSSWGMDFSTIEINSNDLDIGGGAILTQNRDLTIIMPAGANINFADNAIKACAGGGCSNYNKTITIQCKGLQSICDETMAGVKATIEANGGHYNSDYYKEYDTDGKPVEIWNEEGGFKYDKKGNVTEKYDNHGALLSKYTYDGGGNILMAYDANGITTYKRTSYTPAEAAKAIKKGNDNKVTLTFK